MYDGYLARRSNLEEMIASFVAVLANTNGFSKRTITAQDILGRPFRHAWQDAMERKKLRAEEEQDDTRSRLAQKDRERAERARAHAQRRK